MTYASQTTVTQDRSKAEIERTLMRFGASEFTYGVSSQRAMAFVSFIYGNRMFKITVKLPNPKDYETTESGRRRRNLEAGHKAWEQACRQRWRALLLYIKATIEAIEIGIISFEEAFLSQLVLSDHTTVSESIIPRILESGSLPKQLPGL